MLNRFRRNYPLGLIAVAFLFGGTVMYRVASAKVCCGVPSNCIVDSTTCSTSSTIECECQAIADGTDYACCLTGADDDNSPDCTECDSQDHSGCDCERNAEGDAECDCKPESTG